MVVNTESVVGYNNKLKKATTFMRIGVNSDLNIPVRRSTQKHNLGSRAVKLPHSGVETQNSVAGATADAEPGKPEKAKIRTKETQVVKSEKSEKSEKSDSEAGAKLRTKAVSTSHENNLNVLIIVAGALAWFLFR